MAIENRRRARFSAALAIEAFGLPLTSRNVSKFGMQLSCPSMNYRLLHEHFEEGDVRLAIELAGGEQINADARRVYASSYDDEYLIGIVLSGFSEADEQSYLSYLARLDAKSK